VETDQAHPLAVTAADVTVARKRLGSQVRRTPVIRIQANKLSASHPALWLKLESLQSTGAFKARGALNSLLATTIPPSGVIAASGGNHGQAVAWAARLLEVSLAIFVPTTCPEIKLRRLAEYGATMIHPFDQALTVAGAGTVTAEFVE
jgi:threonine dehydratase